MFLSRFFSWLGGGEKSSSAPKVVVVPKVSAPIATGHHREPSERADEEPVRVDWRARADASDARAAARGIDPPRPGRKTYSERHSETSARSTSDIRAQIAAREATGKQCGVLYRVLAERGEDD